MEEVCLESYAPKELEMLKAYFKETKYLLFEGIDNEYIGSMDRMNGSQYLIDTDYHGTHCVDIDTLTAKSIQLDISQLNNCFVEGEYMLIIRDLKSMTIYRDLQEIGQIEFDAKYERCKNYQRIRGSYAQQAGHSVYAVDNDGGLYRIEWEDIKDGKYLKTLVKSNVWDFYIDKTRGLATIDMSYILSLASVDEVIPLPKIDPLAQWTIVTCIAKYWIVSGDLYDQSIITSISNKGDVISTLKLKLTSNGYLAEMASECYDYSDEGIQYETMRFAGIFTLNPVFVRGRRGIMLAIERDGCCHLISVHYGRMSKLQSIASIVLITPFNMFDEGDNFIVISVVDTDTEGVFIAAGMGWTKKITIKLK